MEKVDLEGHVYTVVEQTKVKHTSSDNMFVSRYWNHVMMHIREWNFRYRPGGDHKALPLGDDTLEKMKTALKDADYPDTTA